jgi:FHA domain
MATCPAGHQSASDDFCDVCGFRIDAAVFTQTGASPVVAGQRAGAQPAGPAQPGGPAGQPAAPDETCPRCGTARVGQFCEGCGYSFAAVGQPAPAPPAAPVTFAAQATPVGPPTALSPQSAPSFPPPPKPASNQPIWAPSQAPVSPPPASSPPASFPPASSPPAPAPPTSWFTPGQSPADPDLGPATVPPAAASSASSSTALPGPVAPPDPAPRPDSAQSVPWSAAPPIGATWTAVVTADRDYYETVKAASGPDAAEISFPAYCPERRFRLSGAEVRVGRRSVSRGIDPEIDLTGPPADPGVSRLHAVLVAAPDGSWSVLDPGSANGTFVNGDEIPQGKPVALRDGDRIHLGAWTALAISRDV